MTAANIKVFVSYKWCVEDETQIVAKLEPLCEQRGIELIYDRNKLQHGDLINEFMKELVTSDHIITIFSKEYLESEYCMYELLEIYRRNGASDFHKRIYPIIADDMVLSDFDTQVKYVEHWEEEEKSAGLKLAGVKPTSIIRLRERHKIYQNISDEINDLMDFAGNILVKPIHGLEQENFASLLDRIKPVESPNSSKTQEDRLFINEVLIAIEDILIDSECLYGGLIKKYRLSKNASVKEVSKVIEEQCENDITGLIRIITNLTVGRLEKFERKKSYNKARKLLDAAENLVALISVLGIPQEQAKKLHSSSLYMELSQEAEGSAEITVARKGQSSPKFRKGKPYILGKYAATSNEVLESGIDESNAIDEVIKQVCAKVLPNEDINVVGEKFLNNQIGLELKPDDLRKKNYYFLISASELDKGSVFTNSSVIDELKKRLPKLPIITLKYKNNSLGYVTSDRLLMGEIYNFYKEINNPKFKQ
ncbi:MAG: hypothetical protein methR_P3686 [Methyloprofundus sp.]|nr:MAG: hypothetical protein methR_P3686 [Methyloprofundus sp.]